MNKTVFVIQTDLNFSVEKAWIELEGIDAIVKTASKAKFFIEFHSSCLEGMATHQREIMWNNETQLEKLIVGFVCRDAALQ